MKYKKNLHVEGSKVYSYDTHVATIDSVNRKLYIHGYWSVTTSKHINHVADVFNLEKLKQERDAVEIEKERKDEEAEGLAGLRSIAMVAALGNIFHADDVKASNDWKTRMLKAGLEGRGLIMPDDWDTLDEATKQARLDGAAGMTTLANSGYTTGNAIREPLRNSKHRNDKNTASRSHPRRLYPLYMDIRNRMEQK